MRKLALVIFALGLFAAAAHAQDPDLRPLLSVRERFRARTSRQLLTHRDFVISQGGRTVGRTSTSLLGSVGWSSQPPIQAVAPAAATAGLKGALAEARVGTLPALCQYFNGLPVVATVELTWYGFDRRFREIRIEVNDVPGAEEACPPEVGPLLTAIDHFLGQIPGAV